MEHAPTTSLEDALAQQQGRKYGAPVGVSQGAWDQRMGEQWDFLPGNFGGSKQPTEHGMGMGANPGPPPGSDPWGTASTAPNVAQAQANSQSMMQTDWMRRIGVFDEGGMLPPGGVGVNLSGAPEPVLTPGQWSTLSRATESMQANGAQAADYSVRIENVHVQDVQALQREMDARQKLQMMRFAGRP